MKNIENQGAFLLVVDGSILGAFERFLRNLVSVEVSAVVDGELPRDHATALCTLS